VTTSKPITREQIKDYAIASGDHNPIHLDPDFAKSAGLGDVIAHGMLSMGLMAEALEDAGITSDRLEIFETKFKATVQVGDQLTTTISWRSPTQGDVRLANQSDQEVCTGSFQLRTL
jgi:acyl dehydratase